MTKNYLKPLKAMIERVRKETIDVNTYTFRIDGAQEFSPEPGQFNMVSIPGIGEAPISFSSGLYNKFYFDHTIRNVGRVTNAIFNLNLGDTIYFRGPYGRGWPVSKALGKDILIVAGGIGLAPLRSVISHIISNRDSFGKLVILYGARTPNDLLYQDEIPNWRNQEKTEIFLTVDEVPMGIEWKWDIGVVTQLFNKMEISKDALIFSCGPEIMMRFVGIGLLNTGFLGSQIFVSLERRMKCGIGHCGHCQIGYKCVCTDGPVFRYPEILGLSDILI